MVVSLLPASVDADRLGFMIPQVNPILQVLPCKTHIIGSCQVEFFRGARGGHLD